MEQHRFAVVPDALTHLPSRRDVLCGLVAVGLGLGGVRLPIIAAARKKRRKPRRNAFGCVDVGDFCRNAGQCCSGICQGKKGKKRCKAHDTGGCPAGVTSLGCGLPGQEQNVPCTTSRGVPGRCETTTGNAGYCAAHGQCHECATDAECQALLGPGAACVLCPGDCQEFGGRACFAPGSAA